MPRSTCANWSNPLPAVSGWWYFQKKSLWHSCTICMDCQSIFSGKKEKKLRYPLNAIITIEGQPSRSTKKERWGTNKDNTSATYKTEDTHRTARKTALQRQVGKQGIAGDTNPLAQDYLVWANTELGKFIRMIVICMKKQKACDLNVKVIYDLDNMTLTLSYSIVNIQIFRLG